MLRRKERERLLRAVISSLHYPNRINAHCRYDYSTDLQFALDSLPWAHLEGMLDPGLTSRQSGDVPYTFKHVLSPLPNRSISISDEEQTLHSQGLTPSATLILVPVQGYASAYQDGASNGIVSRVGSAGYSLVSSGVGMVTGMLGNFLAGGAVPPAPERRLGSAPTSAATPAANIRTLRDRDRPDDQQFYNGNAVSLISSCVCGAFVNITSSTSSRGGMAMTKRRINFVQAAPRRMENGERWFTISYENYDCNV